MEEIMSKTNETPKLGPATPKDRRLLDDTELNMVTGGMDLKGASEAMTQRAQQNVAEGMFGLGGILG
jgi:hypothetical protein